MTRSLIELFNKSGIETSKVMKFLSETKGGVENLGFSNQDVHNVIRDIRRRVFNLGDAECGLLFLRELQENSYGNFFYRVDVDDENRVRGLVWVDPRSLNAYKNFGDVVTFDSTYQMNRYCIPFIPITGVNHHYQNILFGVALVRDETEASYKWVLRTWLEAVDNKPPRTIITDQDIALGNAIAEEFIENSQKALETQYLKEVKADYDTEQLERRLVLHSSLEMHASEIYTKEMFKHFQKELMKSTCYIVNSVKNNGTYMSKLYLVEKATLSENCRRKYRVTVFMYEKIECSCKKFEHSGMICKHIIRYLDKKQKIKIPESLIMGRWTMNGNKIAGPLPYAPPAIGNDSASQPLRYGAFCKSFQDLAASGSCSVSRYKYLMGVIDREKRYLKDVFADEERSERTHEAKTQEDY
ncbi:protein FAR1-RELATED SEQUENCE 5-like [Apium graveolens]|uniref:protein FAR1-RELATED SEQUENCE 5-like n=1 Tax=Apium graveolens TaxID=4045 RepID=UPI003D7B1723